MGADLNTRVADRLDVTIGAAPRVICVHCRAVIYYLNEGRSGLRRLAPLEGGKAWTGKMYCPACSNIFLAIVGGKWVIKTDRGYREWKSA